MKTKKACAVIMLLCATYLNVVAQNMEDIHHRYVYLSDTRVNWVSLKTEDIKVFRFSDLWWGTDTVKVVRPAELLVDSVAITKFPVLINLGCKTLVEVKPKRKHVKKCSEHYVRVVEILENSPYDITLNRRTGRMMLGFADAPKNIADGKQILFCSPYLAAEYMLLKAMYAKAQ